MLVKIYRIENSVNDLIYIASTILSLSNRLNIHCCLANKGRLSKFYKEMRHIGINNFTIMQIDEFHVNDLDEARQKEQQEIVKYDPNIALNENRAIDANVIRRLARKIYYQQKKNRICEYQKQYDRIESILTK